MKSLFHHDHVQCASAHVHLRECGMFNQTRPQTRLKLPHLADKPSQSDLSLAIL